MTGQRTEIIKRFALPARARLKRYRVLRTMSEAEQALLPILVEPTRGAIDVGSAQGAYTFRLAALCNWVDAFEARPGAAVRLQENAGVLGLPVQVHNLALSDQAGIAQLRVQGPGGCRSSIETTNPLVSGDGSPTLTIAVPTKTLDELNLRNIGFVKVDVEGHEQAVLRGAADTLARERPTVLIEVEERHSQGSVSSVADYFDRIGYEGFFMDDGLAREVSEFDLSALQDTSLLDESSGHTVRLGKYVNNFIYLPTERAAPFKDQHVSAGSCA